MGVAETEPREAWGWPVGVAVGWPRARPVPVAEAEPHGVGWGGAAEPREVK